MPIYDVPDVNPQVLVVPNQNSTLNDILQSIINLIPIAVVVDKTFNSTEEDLLYLIYLKLQATFGGGGSISESVVETTVAPADTYTLPLVLPAMLTGFGLGIAEISLLAIGEVTGKHYGYKRINRFDNDAIGWGFGAYIDVVPEFFNLGFSAIATSIFGDDADGYRWKFQNIVAENLKLKISYKINYLPK